MQPPTLTDGAEPDPITLRPHRTDDVTDVLAICQDPEVRRWTTVPVPYQESDARDFVEQRVRRGWDSDSQWSFAIDAQNDDGQPQYAGNIALRPSCGSATIGYLLAPWARGRGVMSRAVRLILGWGFHEAGLSVVRWEAHVGNWGSRRVAWATGFRTEGTARGACQQRGQCYDSWTGSIVRGDPMTAVTPWLTLPELRGDGVLLRHWRDDDVPYVAEAGADPTSQHWLAHLPAPYTIADAQEFVRTREEQHADGSAYCWCIADPTDDHCLGSITLFNLTGPYSIAEIGYWAHPEARGQGVTSAATRLVARYALSSVDAGGMGLPVVILHAAAGNAASRRVAVHAGMTRAGQIRNGERARDGTLDDLMLYDFTAADIAP